MNWRIKRYDIDIAKLEEKIETLEKKIQIQNKVYTKGILPCKNDFYLHS